MTSPDPRAMTGGEGQSIPILALTGAEEAYARDALAAAQAATVATHSGPPEDEPPGSEE